MKQTAKNMGAFYGFSEQTMSKYRNGTPEKQRLFEAMKAYFVKVHGIAEK